MALCSPSSCFLKPRKLQRLTEAGIISLYRNKTKVIHFSPKTTRKTITMQAPAADTRSEKILMAEKLHVVPNETKSSVEAFDNYPIVAAITAWDQIGSLSSEVSTSLLAKQASIICERFREENSEPERPSKIRKIGTPSDDSSSEDEQQEVVSCDEHCSSSTSSGSESESCLPGCVSHQVDRMARMSKLMLKMESYHRLIRMEMVAMADDSGIDLEFP
jgi:hypothetical protein